MEDRPALLTLVVTSHDNKDTAVHECPICLEAGRVSKKLAVSLCDQSHWVCLECAERVICKISVHTTVLRSRSYCCLERVPCPMCRGGSVSLQSLEGRLEPVMFGTLYAVKSPKPVYFRGARYPDNIRAIQHWAQNARFTYHCVGCDDFVLRTPDIPVHYIYERFAGKCTQCDLCHVKLPWNEAFDHLYKTHFPGIDLAGVPRRSSLRLLAKRRAELETESKIEEDV